MKMFETEEEKIDRLVSLRVENELQRIVQDPQVVIKAYEKLVEKQSLQIERMKPKAEFYDIVLSSSELIEMKKVSKALNFKGMGRNNTFEYLRHKKILMYDNEPYQRFVDMGLFKIVEVPYFVNKEPRINHKTMTTAKGIEYIKNLLLEDGYTINAK